MNREEARAVLRTLCENRVGFYRLLRDYPHLKDVYLGHLQQVPKQVADRVLGAWLAGAEKWPADPEELVWTLKREAHQEEQRRVAQEEMQRRRLCARCGGRGWIATERDDQAVQVCPDCSSVKISPP